MCPNTAPGGLHLQTPDKPLASRVRGWILGGEAPGGFQMGSVIADTRCELIGRGWSPEE